MADKLYKHSEVLDGLYNSQELTLRQMAEILGCTHTTVLYWMRRFEIECRQFDIGEVNRGKQLSEEEKSNLSEFAKMRFADKEAHPMYGRRHSEESKRKMSETKKYRNALKRQGIYGS